MASGGYKISATIAQKYAPLISRNRQIEMQTPKSEFPLRREAGESNIDLWTDGSIYPQHPDTGKPPPFQTVSELLEYVGDGKSGLYGYVENLCSTDAILRFKFNEALREIQSLREHIRLQNSVTEERDRLLQFNLTETAERKKIEEQFTQALSVSEVLKADISVLREEYNKSKASYEGRIGQLIDKYGQESDERLQLEVDYYIAFESMKEEHEAKLSKITAELRRVKSTLRRRELRLSKLVKTPYGYQSVVRPRKDVHELAPTGGQAKRSLRLARTILVPATARRIQESNAQTGSRQRLCGNKVIQSGTGKVLSSMLSTHEVTTLCESAKLKSVGVRMANYYMNKIGSNVGAPEILETCDLNGITQSGYRAIYKKFTGAVKSAGKGLRIGCLPNPHKVTLSRQQLNLKLSEYVGAYYSICDTLEVAAPAKAKNKEPIRVNLNENNNFFVDVEQVQRTMVDLYNFTLEELQGRPLIFVLKLDEAEIVHSQKMERVSITLMNRALDTSLDPNSAQYFSVQSEREIWPIASFQIPKESHDILKWVFSKTKIPDLIKAQGAGQLLDVPGIGSFHVEWHLAADMKTLKCMYGLKMGANSLHSCIFCNQERVKSVVGTATQASASMASRKCTWSNGLFSKQISAEPVSDVDSQGRWKPILAIPLDKVHVCTLHAFNRMVEKIVHLHFMHIWTIRDEALRKQAVDEMQRVVSLTGAHGGNLIIFKDEDLSGKSNSVPNKPSFSGAHALKLFQCVDKIKGANTGNSPNNGNPRKLYVDVVNAEKNLLRNGQAKKERLDQWIALDALRPYFSGLRLRDLQSPHDFKTKVQTWGRAYVKCFGEHHVTHYMHAGKFRMVLTQNVSCYQHVMVRHAPYFVDKYGSLAVWSCQGFENSHHVAKNAYQRHTQHSGGKSRKSPLLQTYQHWYRIIAHRFRNKEIVISSTDIDARLQGEAAIAARRAASINSSAAAHSALWRAKCQRVGSRWIPLESPEGSST